MEDLIERALKLLCFLPEAEVAGMLMDTGASAEDAFLAVKAGAFLVVDLA